MHGNCGNDDAVLNCFLKGNLLTDRPGTAKMDMNAAAVLDSEQMQEERKVCVKCTNCYF